jgi:hypothetical protein
VKRLGIAVGMAMLLVGTAVADEGPIAGTITAIDPAARTLTVEAAAKGKPRLVVIEIRPMSKIVRFGRATEPGKTGFVEQPAQLAELKPGWTVSVTTRHEGDREIAEVVTVVFER